MKRPFLLVGKPRAGIIETAHDRRRVVIPPTTQKHQKSMEHSDMEALGFQLCDYYEEVEYSLICAKKCSE